ALAADGHPLQEGLRVDGPAAAWVHALLAGHEVLDGEGSGSRALRRANGAVFLAGRASAGGAKGGGPLQRRADLDALAQEVADAEAARGASTAALERTLAELAAAEAAFATAAEGAEQGRHQALGAGAPKGEAARPSAARKPARGAPAKTDEAHHQVATLVEESAALDHDTTTLTAQQAQWEDTLKERRLAVGALEAAARDAEGQVAEADARLARSEGTLEAARTALEARGAQEHKLELERTEILGARRGLVAQV